MKAPAPKTVLAAAVEASHAAGTVLARYFGRKLSVSEKAGAGLVTNVDLAAENAALKILHRRFPHFGVLAEEAGIEKARSPGRWIIDPLDGTTNYVHGFPMFCVSIAAEWDGQIVAGVIYHPILKDLYTATVGGGARLNGKTISVSQTRTPQQSLLTTGFTYRKDEWLRSEMEAFERLSAVARAVRRPGSAALDLAYTARGVFDGFWERRLSPWDVAAGALLVHEAGGKVTDFQGRPFHIECRELLATNGRLHPAMLRAVKTAASDRI